MWIITEDIHDLMDVFRGECIGRVALNPDCLLQVEEKVINHGFEQCWQEAAILLSFWLESYHEVEKRMALMPNPNAPFF